MPRLLTPASSTEMPACDGAAQLAASQLPVFALPPPTMDDKTDRTVMMPPSPPLGPDVPGTAAADAFALPPPPTRARTILQVWPERRKKKAPAAKPGTSTTSTSTKTTEKATTPTPKSSSTRKTARRTAHSLIERRRRSKMNEAFAQLQELVPACTGDMHKLAVLQASIDYVRYLEGCVATLQQRTSVPVPVPVPGPAMDPVLDGDQMDGDEQMDDPEEDDDEDEHDVEDSPDAPPTDTAATAATAALLMLNQDRRGSTDPGRGMRVSDLLST